MRKARIALVGTGWWATSYLLPALQAHPAAHIVAICDLDADKLGVTADVFGIETTYTDLATMLRAESIDGVMVATHHAAHYEATRACLEYGAHVYIEKPMTLLAAQARELVQLAESANRQIVLGYNHNHSPLAIRARDIVRSGELGDVQYINGIFSQHNYNLLAGDVANFQVKVHSPGDVYSDPHRSGGGHGHLQITHLAGMIFFVADLRVARVQSMMAQHGLAVDLVTAIQAEFEGGALGNLGGTSNLPGGGREFHVTFCCERGRIHVDDVRGCLNVHRDGQEPEIFQRPADEQPSYPYFAPTHNFVDVILGQAQNLSGGEIGWRAVELLDAAYRSVERGGAIIKRHELYAEHST